MSKVKYDSEKNRWICRIMAITFRTARDLPSGTISRSWVAKYIKRSEDFVKRNWHGNPFDCERDSSNQIKGSVSLSQESRDIITATLGKERKSIRQLQKEIEAIRGKKKSYGTIHNFLHSLGAKPFHQIPAPRLSDKNIDDRLWFCDFLSDWTEDDFLFLAPSDEFFIYGDRRPNYQNDRIWSLSNEEIPEELKIKQQSKHPKCIGLFLMFTAKRLMWVVKDQGQSWTGQYFRDSILVEHVIPFLKKEENVINVTETTFLHDRAPCMSALATQNLLKVNKIDFFGNNEWPGASPDLNACEHMGAILKERVEQRITNTGVGLELALNAELKALEYDQNLFTSLLRSYPARLDALRKAGGSHTKY